MQKLARTLPAGLMLVVLACRAAGQAGAAKEEIWQPLLPRDAYDELVRRAAKAIREDLDNARAEDHANARAQAVRIAAYTLSVQGGPARHAAIQARALKLADLIKGKDLAAAKALAAKLTGKGKGGPPSGKPDLTRHLDEVGDLMNLYRTRAKGGEGLAPALQTNPRLKGTQNGVEEKLRYLAKKELSAGVVSKEARELALLGWKVAADGSLTAAYAPSQKKDPDNWRKLSLAMRDAGVRLAEAAAKGNRAGIYKAAVALDASCTSCHSAYRNK